MFNSFHNQLQYENLYRGIGLFNSSSHSEDHVIHSITGLLRRFSEGLAPRGGWVAYIMYSIPKGFAQRNKDTA